MFSEIFSKVELLTLAFLSITEIVINGVVYKFHDFMTMLNSLTAALEDPEREPFIISGFESAREYLPKPGDVLSTAEEYFGQIAKFYSSFMELKRNPMEASFYKVIVSFEEMKHAFYPSENEVVIGGKRFTFESGKVMYDQIYWALNHYYDPVDIVITNYECEEEYVPNASEELKSLEDMYEGALKKTVIEHGNDYSAIMSGITSEEIFMAGEILSMEDAFFAASLEKIDNDEADLYYSYLECLDTHSLLFLLLDYDEAMEQAENFFNIFSPISEEHFSEK